MNRQFRSWRPCLIALALVATQTQHAAADVGEMLRHVPKSANAIAVIRVKEALTTRRAQREKWARQQTDRFLAGASVVPPWMNQVLIARQVRPESAEVAWTLTLLNWPVAVSMKRVADFEKAPIQEIAGHEAVATARGDWLVQVGPQLLAVKSGSNRQEVARWIATVDDAQKPVLSDYLVEASRMDASIVMALDLKEMLDPVRIRQRFVEQPNPIEDEQRLDRLVRIVSGLKGIRMTATVDETIRARILVDFSAEVAPFAAELDSLFHDVTADLGMSLEEFQDVRGKAMGTSLAFETELTDAGLRTVLSLFATAQPIAATRSDASAQPAIETPQPRIPLQPESDASRKYAEAVFRVLDDLIRANSRAKNIARTAAWHDSFASRIQSLPTAGVDPDLVGSGDRIASHLRGLAASLRGTAIEVDARQGSITYSVDVYPSSMGYGFWGGYQVLPPRFNVQSNLQQVREEQASAVAAGAKDREAIWLMINDERAAMQRQIRADD